MQDSTGNGRGGSEICKSVGPELNFRVKSRLWEDQIFISDDNIPFCIALNRTGSSKFHESVHIDAGCYISDVALEHFRDGPPDSLLPGTYPSLNGLHLFHSVPETVLRYLLSRKLTSSQHCLNKLRCKFSGP